MNVVIALGLIALGMCIDAVYQHKIRVAECNAYETGYEQGKKEGKIKEETLAPRFPFAALEGECVEVPSMAAPVEMPLTFEEKLKKHGRAVVKLK
jgi:hypothetical protein